MQPCLFIEVLVLQSERLVRILVNPLIFFSDDPRWYSCRTTRDCRLYRSPHAECRFVCSGSSEFADGFLHLRLFGRGLVLKTHRNLGRCRYRYICRPGGFPARGGYRPKRIRWHLRGRLKLLRFSDGLAGVLGLNPTYGYYMIQFYLASRLY